MKQLNTIELEGNISKINLHNGNNGQFGTITIAVDDGYYSKSDHPNTKDVYVERNYFHMLSVNEKITNSLFLVPMIGDELIISGKLVTKKWTNQEHPVTMIEVSKIVKHTPKALIELGRAHGLIKPTKVQNNGHQSQSYGAQSNNSQHSSYQQPTGQQGGFHKPS